MSSSWFVRGGGKVYGPLDAARLKRLADEGKIDRQTDVSQNAAGPWYPAGNVKGLFPAVALTPIPTQSLASAGAVSQTGGAASPATKRARPFARFAVAAVAGLACIALVSWAALSFFSASSGIDAKLAAAQPKAFARGLEDGEQDGRRWAGRAMPDDVRLKEIAKQAAEKAIPSNLALIGSGSDEERDAYAHAHVSRFAKGYKEESPLRLKRARQKGEDDGHQAGFMWAKLGKKELDDERLTAAAENRAGEVIPSNLSLVNSGSDEERQEYVKGFVSQFLMGYRKAK